jgi:hypothetical protein
MKNNLSRAKMALPNGYCTLPLQQSCQFANACLTCPVFVTTAEFLPQHRRQLDQTRSLIGQAERNGQQRLAEMNRTVETNLLTIIDGLTTPCGGNCGQSCACTPNRPDGTVPMPVDHAHHLARHARQRHERTLQQASETLTALADSGRPVSRLGTGRSGSQHRAGNLGYWCGIMTVRLRAEGGPDAQPARGRRACGSTLPTARPVHGETER